MLAVSRHVLVNKLYVETASQRNHHAEEVTDFSAWKTPSRLQSRASNPSTPPRHTPDPRAGPWRHVDAPAEGSRPVLRCG